jgi:predicted DNA-binding transcriptional regulator AlpA
MILPQVDIAAIADADIPAVLSVLAAWQAQLSARLLAAAKPAAEPEALLDVEQAARKLAVTEDWLYRRGVKLGLAVKLGSGTLRFSTQAIDNYIRQQAARPAQTRQRNRRVDRRDSIIS